jgi:hypothetical protein
MKRMDFMVIGGKPGLRRRIWAFEAGGMLFGTLLQSHR